MGKFFCSLIVMAFGLTSFGGGAADYTERATKAVKIGDWNIIEFAADKQIIYKMATEALNQNLKETYFSFYLTTSDKCKPSLAEMSMLLGGYSETLAHGHIPFSYKIPGQKEITEVVQTRMEQGDQYAFFKFQQLSLRKLMSSGSKGNLAIWVPASGNGEVHGSSNMYFSLNGLSQAYSAAMRLCSDNL
ncbi:TPA: hypothetical protein ACNGYZ_003481 [Raoultella planticola]